MTKRLLALALCGGLFVAPASAHEKLRMAIAIDPAEPIVATPSTITVKLTSVSGSPVTGHETPLELIADMTGHPMAPVKAALAPTGEPGVFSGPIEFTMAGMWRLTVVVEDKPAPMRAVMGVHVGTGEPEEPSTTADEHSEAAPPASGSTNGPTVVDLESAPMPTIFRPWLVVYFVVGLLVVAELAAGVAKWRRNRRRLQEEGLADSSSPSPWQL